MKSFLIQADKKYFFPVLLAFVFALPFNTLPAFNSILMSLLFIFWIVKLFTSEEPVLFRTPLDIPLLGFFFWVALSLFWTADFHESFNSFIALGKQIFLFYLVATTINTKDQFVKILAVFLAAILITDLFAIIDFFQRGGNLLDRHIRAGPLGSEGDYNSLTMYIIIFLPLGFIYGNYSTSKKIKTILYLFSLISLLALFLGYTRAGWITIGLQLLLFYFYHSRRLFYYLLGFVFCSIFITILLLQQYKDTYSTFKQRLEHTEDTINPFTFETRAEVWKFGVAEILQRPFFGYGYGREIFQKVNKDKDVIKLTPHLHNTLLEIGFEVGITGLILFISCFWVIICQSIKSFKFSTNSLTRIYSLFMIVMVSGFIFKNLFDHMLIGNVAEIFWVLIGLLFAFSKKLKTSPSF